MKVKTVFVCNQCGCESPKWLGKCPGCSSWNSMSEEKCSAPAASHARTKANPTRLSEVVLQNDKRMSSGIDELDIVLGGGLVKGSLVLVGGDPGIGKSTLLLQAAQNYSTSLKVLYASGEESEGQIKMRADRLSAESGNLYLLCETDIDHILDTANDLKPDIIIADSIQTLSAADVSSSPGSVSQVRECCLRLMQYAKTTSVSVFVVGHVTKEGAIAGPRVLEHMVDCVLYFEGDRHQSYRILRAVKNRFGSTNEIGVFEMQNQGLMEVPNPSVYMLSGRPEHSPGSSVACCMEGTRPILTEIQALISPTGFGIPRRMAAGFDYNRMVMLLAVIEKHLKYNMQSCDAYINVVGGLKITETCADLPLVLAVISGFKGVSLPACLASFGEIGLSGELRSASQSSRRIAELSKMGFDSCIVPYHNFQAEHSSTIKLFGAKTIGDVISVLKNHYNIQI